MTKKAENLRAWQPAGSDSHIALQHLFHPAKIREMNKCATSRLFDLPMAATNCSNDNEEQQPCG